MTENLERNAEFAGPQGEDAKAREERYRHWLAEAEEMIDMTEVRVEHARAAVPSADTIPENETIESYWQKRKGSNEREKWYSLSRLAALAEEMQQSYQRQYNILKEQGVNGLEAAEVERKRLDVIREEMMTASNNHIKQFGAPGSGDPARVR